MAGAVFNGLGFVIQALNDIVQGAPALGEVLDTPSVVDNQSDAATIVGDAISTIQTAAAALGNSALADAMAEALPPAAAMAVAASLEQVERDSNALQNLQQNPQGGAAKILDWFTPRFQDARDIQVG